MPALKEQKINRQGKKPRRSHKVDRHGRTEVRLGITMTNILVGNEDLSTWDVEELRHGRRRDKNGKFQGRPPTLLPRNLFEELAKRLFGEAQQKLLDMLMPALDALEAIIDGEDISKEDAIRLKAIESVMNRVLGKQPDTVVAAGADKKYQRIERTTIDRDLGDYDDESQVLEATYVED
jgi:hypothetical protein